MVSERKKQYMKDYNKRPEVKARKAAYMRKVRSESRTKIARDMVNFLLNAGYENMAFEHAKKYAPEMLVTIKSPVKRKRK